jgi:recombination protein RecR
MSPFDTLIEIFRKFPGIGPRQARRFVYHLIRLSDTDIKQFSDGLISLKKSFKECTSCHRYFSTTYNVTLCSICSDTSRSNNELIVVAHDSDLDVVEKSNMYRGQYFVLGGTIPILEQAPSYIRERALLSYIEEHKQTIKEVIIAMSITAEGDHTTSYIKNLLTGSLTSETSITTLGRGVSTGSELEYADSETIRHALGARTKL